MELSNLYNYMRGYVKIEIRGLFTERFLNMCAKKGICLWNVQKTADRRISACISIKGFKMLVPIARKSRCHVHIVSKLGFPFFLHRYRRRKAFAAGIAVCAILLYYMTTFIWVVEVNIDGNIDKELINTHLETAGIRPGVGKSSINSDTARSYMMTEIPEIAYITFNTRGTTVTVDVKERVKLPKGFDKDEPCNITATCDGVITDYTVLSGVPVVKINDVVRRGQILVSGVTDSEAVGMSFSHSEGEVLAQVWHEEYADLPMFEEKKTKTGKKKTKHGLKFFDFYVKLYVDDKVEFENYERISYVKNLSLGNNNKLPFSFHHDEYRELSVTRVEMTEEQAIKAFEKELDKKYNTAEIIKKEFTVYDNKIKAVYECIEDIGEKSAILYEEAKNGTDGKDPGSGTD